MSTQAKILTNLRAAKTPDQSTIFFYAARIIAGGK
jgi:hypothetical protein